jgi:hypothetical protein
MIARMAMNRTTTMPSPELPHDNPRITPTGYTGATVGEWNWIPLPDDSIGKQNTSTELPMGFIPADNPAWASEPWFKEWVDLALHR